MFAAMHAAAQPCMKDRRDEILTMMKTSRGEGGGQLGSSERSFDPGCAWRRGTRYARGRQGEGREGVQAQGPNISQMRHGHEGRETARTEAW